MPSLFRRWSLFPHAVVAVALSSVACGHPPDATAPVSTPAPLVSAPASSSALAAPSPSTTSATPAAGTSPASDAPPGASTPGAPGGMCGGIAGFRCADGLFCDFPAEAHCGAADQTGTCQPRPGACTRIHKPVCGCDDRTYPTECVAHSAGIAVATEGECPKR